MHVLWRGDYLQRMRLVSGLILFTFAATHFINHALGLISIDVMQVVQQWRWMVTRSWPGTVVLLAALLMHASLGLYKLAGTRDIAAAALGTRADPARDIDPVPLAAAYRQYAHRARLLQRERHLRLRARASVAGERHHPKLAARHRVGARLHGHSFLAAALCALPAHLPATADAGHYHSASRARRLCRRRQQRRRRHRDPVGVGQSQGPDSLARRGGGRDACVAAQLGAL